MGTTLKGEFETRREADMSVERLVQEYGLDRDRILVVASGRENSASDETAGSGKAAGAPAPESRDDAALNGAITVSVELDDDTLPGKVRSAFSEFDASAAGRA